MRIKVKRLQTKALILIAISLMIISSMILFIPDNDEQFLIFGVATGLYFIISLTFEILYGKSHVVVFITFIMTIVFLYVIYYFRNQHILISIIINIIIIAYFIYRIIGLLKKEDLIYNKYTPRLCYVLSYVILLCALFVKTYFMYASIPILILMLYSMSIVYSETKSKKTAMLLFLFVIISIIVSLVSSQLKWINDQTFGYSIYLFPCLINIIIIFFLSRWDKKIFKTKSECEKI